MFDWVVADDGFSEHLDRVAHARSVLQRVVLRRRLALLLADLPNLLRLLELAGQQVIPANKPTSQPTNQGEYCPASQPTSQPGLQVIPANKPTSQPTNQGEYCPASQPTSQPANQRLL
jgi:hypothetical protein